MGSLLTKQDFEEKQTDQSVASEICNEECIESVCPKRSLYSTNDAYNYYTGQLSIEHFYDLYTDLCGVYIYDDKCTFKWNLLRDYLGKDYNHLDIITSPLFVDNKIMRILRVEITFGDELDELDFRTDLEKTRLADFGKMGGKLLKYPAQGQQLFCTIKVGDMYTATFMKFPFMTEVFNTLRLSTRSAIMSTTEARLKTCKRLQNTYDISVEDFAYNLAEAGLYLTTDQALSQCFECGGLVNIGKCDFDPWYMHAKYHPCCPYLLKTKGQEYIDRVRREFKKQVTINPSCILQFDNRWHAPDTEDNSDSDWSSGSECSDYFSENEEDENEDDDEEEEDF